MSKSRQNYIPQLPFLGATEQHQAGPQAARRPDSPSQDDGLGPPSTTGSPRGCAAYAPGRGSGGASPAARLPCRWQDPQHPPGVGGRRAYLHRTTTWMFLPFSSFLELLLLPPPWKPKEAMAGLGAKRARGKEGEALTAMHRGRWGWCQPPATRLSR